MAIIQYLYSGIVAAESILSVGAVIDILLFTMLPRFMIGIRALYDRDSHRDCGGIDSGFGILSRPATDENQTVSAIAFADVTPGEPEGQAAEDHTGESAGEIIPLEEVRDGAHQG